MERSELSEQKGKKRNRWAMLIVVNGGSCVKKVL